MKLGWGYSIFERGWSDPTGPDPTEPEPAKPDPTEPEATEQRLPTPCPDHCCHPSLVLVEPALLICGALGLGTSLPVAG